MSSKAKNMSNIIEIGTIKPKLCNLCKMKMQYILKLTGTCDSGDNSYLLLQVSLLLFCIGFHYVTH